MSATSPVEASPCSWSAFYYDGRTTSRQTVTVVLSEHGLTIQKEDAARLLWSYKDIHQAQGKHWGEPVRLECGCPLPEAIVINDPSFLPALRAHVHDRYRQFHFPTPTPRRIGLLSTALIASILAIVAIVRWGIPALADRATPLVPTSWEVALGKAVLEQMVSEDQRCTNGVLQKETRLLLERLVNPSTSPYELHLTIVDINEFNAYALPGGEIVVFRPLLQATTTPDELAGVLAHEVQHILLRHSTKSLLRDLSLTALIGAVLGDVTGLGALSIQTAHTLSTLHYSRDMEEQADVEGIRLLQRTSFNPSGLIRFFETLQSREKHVSIPAYLSTHPQTEERIAKLYTLLSHMPDAPASGQDEAWKQTTRLCRE
jgi:beta-barrel assembly-enhancing protease